MTRCLGCMEEFDDKFMVCPHCGFVVGTEAQEAYHMQPGTLLQERYIVGKVLGFGGFGVTYIGWDIELERKVAIKEYLPTEFATRMPEQTQLTVFSGDKEEQFKSGMEKFLEEAKRLAKFHSSNGIIHIYDSFEEYNTAYIVMEYLEGESLKEKLAREGQLSVDEALTIILPILYALREVHEIGILHRDIAPDNIYLTNEYDSDGNRIVKLLDFGAARYSTTRHSKSLTVLVKAGYSPEEQYRSRGDQGPWTDVYSIAATFYKMVSGVTPQDAMERSVKDMLKPMSKLGVNINKNTETAILNAMNIKIENRTQSVDELIYELEAEVVKRKKEKIKKVDVGKWPMWLKLSTVAASVAVIALGIFVAKQVYENVLGHSTLAVNETRVPNIINFATNKAEHKVTDAEMVFQILDKQTSADVPAGRVLAQTELGGCIVEKASTLGVVISAGEETTYVPDVLNYMLESADAMIKNANLTCTTKEEESDDAPGSVTSQSEEANKEVNVGTNVELVISKGRGFDSTVQTKVPDLVGKHYDDAKKTALESCLYVAKAEGVISDEAEGTVLEQDKLPGEPIMQDSTIMVKVSIGKGVTHVPDVEYKPIEEAKALLEANHLKVKIKYEESDTVAKDNVIHQSVKAGKEVAVGTTVTVFVSKGNDKADNTLTANDAVVTKDVQQQAAAAQAQEDKKNDNNDNNDNNASAASQEKDNKVSVPSVVGEAQSRAEDAIKNAGLTVVIANAFDSNVSEGNVISQSVESGKKIDKNSAVMLTISKGPSAPSGWTTDASFANSKWYTAQTKTQYRHRTRSVETKTSHADTENGWNRDDSKTVSKWIKNGALIDNGEAVVYPYENAQSKRTVETYSIAKTRQEPVYATKYYYFYITDWTAFRWYDYGSVNDRRDTSSWEPFRYCKTISNYSGKRDGYRCPSGPKYHKDELWYSNGTRQEIHHYNTVNYTATGYKYQDWIKEFTYSFWRYTDWSSWSQWQDAVVSKNETTDVETQTVYYYTAK